MPPRSTPANAGNDGEEPLLRHKLADLVARQRYSEAIRVRGQALLRRPELDLRPSEAQLWCLEGRQAAAAGQGKRAEAAFRKAMALGLEGEALERLARLRLDQGHPQQALALLEESFQAGRLPPPHAGAYLKLLLLAGETERARALIRDQPRRFQGHQLQWAAGVFRLLEGDAAGARRQFASVAGAVSLGDHGAVWRAWASLEAGDTSAAATALNPIDHPAKALVALDLAARSGQPPADLIDLSRRDLPRREAALALTLVHHLRQGNLLSAAQLLQANDRSLRAALPELASLRRPLLVLAGQQAVERQAPAEAIACWRPLVHPSNFDPDLALRLYPLLEASDHAPHHEEAERLTSQLLAWLRRAARANPSVWPETLLSTTLARLHCWQADQTIKLGERQRARRAVEEAQRLAPDLADVMGRRGLLAWMEGDDSTAVALLWQALEGGVQTRFLYDTLEALLEATGQEAEAARLRLQHGPRFGELPGPEPATGGRVPAWLEVLSQADLPAMARALRHAAEPGAGLDALRVLVEHVPHASTTTDDATTASRPAKASLALPAASDRWDALLASLSPDDQVEALTALLLAIQRFCRRAGKPIAAQIALRQAQLEGHAAGGDSAAAERALRGLLLLHGLGLKRSQEPGVEAARLLRRASQPHRTLPLALLDLRFFASTRPWRALVDDLLRQEPHNALLSLALATMERAGSYAYAQRSRDAFDQARRQQDGVALAACRQERWWSETHPVPSRRRLPGLRAGLDGDRLDDPLDFAELLRRFVRSRSKEERSDQEAEAASPEFEPPPGQSDPPSRPRQRSRRRTFMDL